MKNLYSTTSKYYSSFVLIVILFITAHSNLSAQTTYTDFNQGAAVIDMGIANQTDNNGLKPYGLVITLVNAGIPVNWIINPDKDFGAGGIDVNTKFDGVDLIISGTVSSALNSAPINNYDCKAGPFLIAAEYMIEAEPIIQNWINDNNGLTVYWNLDAITQAPVHGLITSFPNIIVYDNGNNPLDIIEGFYDRAGITSGYRTGVPGDLTSCDQFYVLSHHTDPDTSPWTQSDTDNLYDFVVSGGNIWMGCHDVSLTEDVLRRSGSNTQLNFLSNNGLLPYKDLSTTTYPWLNAFDDDDGNTDNNIDSHNNTFVNNDIMYNGATAGHPYMQFIGDIEPSLNGNSEHVYIPFDGDWRGTTTVGMYDNGPTDSRAGGQSALVAYGPAYGNNAYGDILYTASHISSKNGGTNAQWVGEARLFGNFLFESALGTAPQITVDGLDIAMQTACSDSDLYVEAQVTGATGVIIYSWTSEVISGASPNLSFNPSNAANITIHFPTVAEPTVYKIILTISDTRDGCSNPITAKFITTVSVNPRPEVMYTQNDVLCNGASTGDINVTVNNGVSPYTYSWTGPNSFTATTEDISGLAAGTYNLIVTDANSCNPSTTPVVIEITEPALTACAIQVANCPPLIETACADSDLGSTVDWIPPSFSYECCTSVAGDDYSFFMEFDLPESANDCWEYNRVQRIGSNNLRLFQSSGTDVNFTAPLQYFDNTNETPINLEFLVPSGIFDWTLEVLDGATVVYTDTIVGISNSNSSLQTITIPNTVPNGAYKLKFSFDDNGTNLGASDHIEIDRMYYNATLLDVTCAGGINFVVTSTHNPGDLFEIGTTQVTYTATYTPVSGDPVILTCSFDVNVTGINLSETIADHVDATCSGGANGSITVTASGGTPPYYYSLDNIDFTNTSGIFNGLTAGTYTIYVQDSNGCTDPSPLQITLVVIDAGNPEITAPSPLNIEGCDENDITELTARYPFSDIQSIDIKDTYVTIGYTASDDTTIQSITYVDVITPNSNCPFVVTRTFTITDICDKAATATQVINVNDTTAPVIVAAPADISVQCIDDVPAMINLAYSDNCDADGIVLGLDAAQVGNNCGGTITRTWNISDVCGNPATQVSQVITIQDTTAPVIVVAPADISVQCIDDVPAMINLAYSDNCDADGTVLGLDAAQVGNNCGGTITRTWNISDACGNPAAQVSQIITIQDTTPPVIVAAPADISVQCIDDVPAMINLAYSDNCDADGTVLGLDAAQVGNNCGGTITRTWNISDVCGNPATQVNQIITIQDTTAPVIVAAPADISVQCIDDVPAMINLAYSDNCDADGTVLGLDAAQVGNNCGGTITRTWNISDVCGNPATQVNQIITIQDTTAPVIVAAPADISVQCIDDVPAMISLAYSDNCDADGTVLGLDAAQVGNNCGGTITRAWNISDVCGNPATQVSQVITIQDTTAPDITSCSLNLNTPSTCDAATNESIADQWNLDNIAALQDCVTDNCDTDLMINSNYDFTNLNQECGPCGTLSVTYDVIDDCGNNSPITLNLSFNDNTPPDLTNCSVGNETLECDGANNEAIADQWNLDNIAALEACAEDDTDISVTSNYAFVNLNTTCGLGGTIPVLYTITDECGGAATLNVTLTLEDTTPPDLSGCAVTSQALECDGTNNEAIADQWNLDNITAIEGCAADSCDPDFSGQVTSDYAYSNLSSTCGLGGTIAVIYTITDDCGNAEILNATLTLEDTTPPDLSGCAVTSQALECDGTNNEAMADQWNLDNITALEGCVADSCDPDFSGQVTSDYAYSNLSSTCGLGGTIAVIYTITDDCGNAETLNATLTLEDTTPPDLSGCAVISQALECDGTNNEAIADQWNLDNITAIEGCAADSCDPDFSGQVTSDYAYSNLSSTCGLGGDIITTYTIIDKCNNSTTLSVTLTLEDATPPDLSGCAVTNQVLECTDDNEAAADAWNADNIAALEACASDSCDPDFSGQVTSDYDFANLNTTCGPCGTLNVNYTITDDCGNSSTLNAILSFDDITIPDLSDCNVNDLTLECSGENNEALADQWNLDNITALEACADDLNVTVSSNYAFTNLVTSCGLGGTISVIYTVTDDCDNSATLNITLTLEDTTPPDLVNCTVTDVTLECAGTDNESIADAWNSANITDLETCGTDSCVLDNTFVVTSDYTFSNLSSTCGAGGTITITYTVSDDCNNSQQLTAILTLEDTTPPDLVNCTVTDETLECAGDDNESIADAWNSANITALETCGTDSCDVDNTFVVTSDYAFSNLSSSCGFGGTIAIIYSITDDCGNTEILNATLTLEDTTPPDLVNCNVIDATVECTADGNEAIADQWNADNIAALENCGTDACDIDNTFVVTSDYDFANLEPSCGVCGAITVNYTIADDCGNETILTATLTLSDGTNPDLDNCEVVDTTIECSGIDNQTIADQWNADNITTLENCAEDIAVIITSDYAFTNLSSTCGAGGTITVTYTATDDCDNITTLTATLTLEDTTPPDLVNCSVVDTTLECVGEDNQSIADAWNNANIEALQTCGTDACDIDNTFVVTSDYDFDNLSVTCGHGGTMIVNYTVTDDCGNSQRLIATLTLTDTTAPVLTLGDDGSAECTGTDSSMNLEYIDWVSSYAGITATDNCGSVILTFIEGQWINDGCSDSIIVTFIATDECGLQGEVIERSFTISDTTAPEIIPEIDDIVFYCNELPPAPIFEVIEGCSEANIEYNVTITGTEGAPDYQIVRTWTITDDCGNVTIKEQLLLVEPGCNCLEDMFISKAITPNGDIYNDYFKVEGIDDCGIPTLKMFNRWGALVYQSDNYDAKKGRWRGTAENGGTTLGGNNELPTGTYYYIIEIRNSNVKAITGHVYLSTN